MYKQLKSQIRVAPPMDYVAAQNFLSSLIYAVANSQLS